MPDFTFSVIIFSVAFQNLASFSHLAVPRPTSDFPR